MALPQILAPTMNMEAVALQELMRKNIIGIPTAPVVAVPVLRVVGPHATYYESRTSANGGMVVISKQRPPEHAANSVLRPNVDFIEVGAYEDGDDYDLVKRIRRSDDNHVIHNGKKVPVKDKAVYIAQVAQHRGLTRMVTHEQHPGLQPLAQECGLEYREKPEKFSKLGTKSGLNTALSKYQERHHGSPLGSFGVNFNSQAEVYQEVMRLREYGVGAYVKMDYSETGTVAAGGEGQIALNFALPVDEIMSKVQQFAGPEDAKIGGVVQMYIPNPVVYSISSGENTQTGEHEIYEAHKQTADGATADGAMPLPNDSLTSTLLQNVWPEVKRFFKDEGITGDANINCLALPPEYHELAKKIYNNPDLAPIVFVDFNYRGISGTKNAMARCQEDTGGIVNIANFRSRGIKVHPFYAANPHLLYLAATSLGLVSGKRGNFAVINMGTFNPPDFASKDKFKTQVFVNGTINPGQDVDKLEELLSHSPNGMLKSFDDAGFRWIEPQAIDPSQYPNYTDFLVQGMKLYVDYAKQLV